MDELDSGPTRHRILVESGASVLPGLKNGECESPIRNENDNDFVASEADIDTALRYGTNYPKGPFAWRDQIGGDIVSAWRDAIMTANA